MNTYKAIVIGCGRIGCGFDDDPSRPNKIMTHAGAYANHPRTKLVALVDVDRAKLDAYGKKYGVKTYTDACEALAAEKPDMVSICTLMDTHAELVKAAVAAGVKMIWCEKPLAPTVEEGKELEELCAKNSIVLINNLIKRFQPEFHEIKKLVPGIKPQKITAWYTGGFLNNGIHQVDLIRFLLGEFTQVKAAVSKAPPRTPADPNYDGTITLANGMTADIIAADETNSAVTTKGGLLRVLIEGENGVLDLDHWNATLTQDCTARPLSVKGQQDYMRNAVTNMIEAHEQNKPVHCSGTDGWKAVEICNAFRDSAQSGNTIPLRGAP
jgi:predicted dehydrogenase